MRFLVISLTGKKKHVLLSIIIFFMGMAYLKTWENPAVLTLSPLYKGSSSEKKIAFTFNVVWGEEYIPQILEILNANNVNATFFIGGQWAENYPDLVAEIFNSGNEIGNHGYSHPHPDRISKQDNYRQIKKTEDVINSVTGIRTTLFAPPYGERGDNVLKAAEEAGYTTILWSIDTLDWQRPDPSLIVSRVLSKSHNGAIVLMHPTAPTVSALPIIINDLKKQGYDIVKIPTLLADLEDNGTAIN